MNIPNLLTLARLLAVPPIIVLFRNGHGVAASVVFLAAMLTDCMDGWVARRFGQVSSLGTYLDPVVDKILIVALFYEVAIAGVIPAAIPHLLLARELLQSGVRTVAALNGSVVGANWMGKTKAAVQVPVLVCAFITHSTITCFSVNVCASIARAGGWMVLALAWVFFAVFFSWNRDLILANAKREAD